jgi:hypothetical protein
MRASAGARASSLGLINVIRKLCVTLRQLGMKLDRTRRFGWPLQLR